MHIATVRSGHSPTKTHGSQLAEIGLRILNRFRPNSAYSSPLSGSPVSDIIISTIDLRIAAKAYPTPTDTQYLPNLEGFIMNYRNHQATDLRDMIFAL